MQPSPMAETSRLLFPSLRFCILFCLGKKSRRVVVRGLAYSYEVLAGFSDAAKAKIPTTLSRGGDSRIQAEPDPTEAAPNYWGRTAMALPEVWWRLAGQPELPWPGCSATRRRCSSAP